MRVLHIITGLNQGGAETSLLRLLEQLHSDREPHAVICLMGEGR
jgi:hypothetical protein